MSTPTKVTVAACGVILSAAAVGCSDNSSGSPSQDQSQPHSGSQQWTPGPDLNNGASMVDGPQYRDVKSLLDYGQTAVVGTFEPQHETTTAKSLMSWNESVPGMDLVVWTIHVDQTLAGDVPDKTVDVILAGSDEEQGKQSIGAEPGDRAVLFIDTVRTPSGQKWNVAGVNQGVIALDDQDRLTPSVDATPSLTRQINSLKDLDGLRSELEERS